MSKNSNIKSRWGRELCIKKDKFYKKYSKGKVLDYGCGYGAFGLSLLKSGFDVSFADIDQEYLDKIDVEPEKKVLVDPNNLESIEGTYDTILLGDVIEHIDNLVDFMDEVRKKIHRRILLSVPRREVPQLLRSLNLTWAAYEDPSHLRYFEEENIMRLVDEKFKYCKIEKYFPRKKNYLILDFLERFNYYPGYLAVLSTDKIN